MTRSALLATLVLASCGMDTGLYERTGSDIWYQEPTDRVDILFVVDDSHSMAEEQAALSRGFESFIQEIEETNTDFHLGVITTSFDYEDSERGQILGIPPVIDKTMDYVTLFTERVVVGTTGSDREKGLEAAAWALSPVMITGVNEGFIRSDAFLLVIFVSDEEDCSDRGALEGQTVNACYEHQELLVPVEEFILEIRAIKERPDMVYVGSIVGMPRTESVCENSVPGTRYIDAAYLTGGLVADVCSSDWSSVMYSLGLNASGILQSFMLTDRARPGTITVAVDEVEIAEDENNGWTYDIETWYITFHGDAIPPRGSVISANYTIG